ncbi:SH2 domain-containing protein 3C-like [Carcharodon carcharias]|uniref:SH2 domain-containing protein 3C-like n=1 Tax=Carcharodon carcharias TaxID=13397 RepID=UPI001B7DFA7C|nr:SH2 domain-containing protein 3C-like [Carcharodon carcharias]
MSGIHIYPKHEKYRVHLPSFTAFPNERKPLTTGTTMSLKKLKFFKFKGFGSLTNIPRNLSLRRSSSSSIDDKKKRLKENHLGLQIHPEIGQETVDDLETIPRSPSYAHSSEMYTYIGTMPRRNSNRVQKPVKTTSTSDGQAAGRSRLGPLPPLPNSDQNEPPEKVPALGESDKEAKPAQGCPSPSCSKPLFSDSKPAMSNSTNSSPKSTTLQNMSDESKPVEPGLMDFPRKLSEPGNGDGQTKALSAKDEAGQLNPTSSETVDNKSELVNDSNLQNMDSKSEYVKFSKDKYILDSSPEKLHKELEEELKLSSTDLRSHAWYHGRIPREVSENLVQKNGDFLIRDSLTCVGDYVLTCRWRNEPLHFKINKVMIKPNETYTRIQYLFERESFDNIPALVRFYIGNRKPVSEQSGAIIYTPINRTLPLRYLEASYGLSNGKHGMTHPPTNQKGGYIKRRSVTMTDGLTSDKIIRSDSCGNSIPSPHHKETIRNFALSMDQIKDIHHGMSPVNEIPLSPEYSTSLKHKSQLGRVARMAPSSPVLQRPSEPQLSSPIGNRLCQDSNREGPPEVSSGPHCNSTHSSPLHGSLQSAQRKASDSFKESEHTHYCELRPSSPIDWERQQLELALKQSQMMAKSYVERLKVEENPNVSSWQSETSFGILETETYLGPMPACVKEKEGLQRHSFTAPVIELVSSFKLNGYQSILIPLENKPLEMSVLKKVKELLAEEDPKTTAKHITKVDCMVARILAVSKELQKQMGVSSGLELLTLPHGHQLRLDLLERFNTMAIMMAVDILGCTGSTEERAALLHKTIQLAAELKSNMGNMFGFAAVMKALEMPQISRLEQTWMTLRQRHTEGAILYEKKLKPFMKNMNEGREVSPLTNTTFPHVVPLITLLERNVVNADNLEAWEVSESGVEVVMSHLEAARTIAHHGGLYRTNAELKLQGFQENEQVLEIFKTEFQMRLLWGSRGAEGNQVERYEKFDKVLSALSNKLEPPVRHSEL